MCFVINNSVPLIREMTFLGRLTLSDFFCSLSRSEVAGLLLALSPFVGKAKLYHCNWNFSIAIFFNVRKKSATNTSGCSHTQALTAITGN